MEVRLRLDGPAASTLSNADLEAYRARVSQLSGLSVSRIAASASFYVSGQINTTLGGWALSEGYAVQRAVASVINASASVVNVTLHPTERCDNRSSTGDLVRRFRDAGNVTFEVLAASAPEAANRLRVIEDAVADRSLRRSLISALRSLLSPLGEENVPAGLLAGGPSTRAVVTVRVQLFDDGEAAVALSAIEGVSRALDEALLDAVRSESSHAEILSRPVVRYLSEQDLGTGKGGAAVFLLALDCARPPMLEAQEKRLAGWLWPVVVAGALCAVAGMFAAHLIWHRCRLLSRGKLTVRSNRWFA